MAEVRSGVTVNFMKKYLNKWLLLTASAVVLQGCVAVPPLIQVQHKESNDEIVRRLDSIDRRLDRLEERAAGKSETK